MSDAFGVCDGPLEALSEELNKAFNILWAESMRSSMAARRRMNGQDSRVLNTRTGLGFGAGFAGVIILMVSGRYQSHWGCFP